MLSPITHSVAPSPAPAASGDMLSSLGSIGARVSTQVQRIGHGIGLLAAGTGVAAPAAGLPGLAYFGSSRLLRGHENGSAIATHAGLAAQGIVGSTAAGAAGTRAATGGLLGGLQGAFSIFRRLIPGAVAVVGGVQVANVLRDHGELAAVPGTAAGRHGALNALGGLMLLVPHPFARLAGAGVMLAAIANDLGALRHLDDPRYAAPSVATLTDESRERYNPVNDSRS